MSERERGQSRAYMLTHDSRISVSAIDTQDTIRYVHERPLKRTPHVSLGLRHYALLDYARLYHNKLASV